MLLRLFNPLFYLILTYLPYALCAQEFIMLYVHQVTPVIRDCDQLSLAGIEQEIARMGQKARDGQISLDELAGGTFTVSNGTSLYVHF